ncbi:MAG TPA: caspase family protein [Actinocrinis sp.]|nr:caspase family protein [Actinocrinis sp.]
MKGTALLVGGAPAGLTGVDNDLDAMAAALESRGLTVQRCSGPAATRAGILAAFDRLAARARPEQAAVVYYSGHGGRAAAPPPDTPGPSLMDLQFIAPYDYADSKPGDFRGITSVELTAQLARLTRTTGNVTAIFDCCHSSHMARKSLVPKGLSAPEQYEVLRDHVERLRAAGTLSDVRSVGGNPNAVRIVACAPEQAAFEYDGVDGRRIGVLTESLTVAFAEAGEGRVTWQAVMDRVGQRVLDLSPFQRPQAEGPAHRFLFDTEEDDLATWPAVVGLEGGRARIGCAALLGIGAGDVFAVHAPSPDGAWLGARIGTLAIDSVSAFAAVGSVDFDPGSDRVPIGARAQPTRAVATPMPVLLPDGDPRTAAVAAAVESSALLRAARADEPWLAAVQVDEDGGLTVADRIGPLHPPRRAADARPVLRNLEALARVVALRRLAVQDDTWAFHAPVTVEWGTVQGTGRCPLPASGATVHVGEKMYLSVRNDGGDDVFVSLFDLGVSGSISLLTDYSPFGVRLPPGREYAFGFDDYDNVLPGQPIHWPDGPEPTIARPESLLALVTSAQQDVSVLTQRGAQKDHGPLSPLGSLLQQIGDGRDRDIRAAGGQATRYDTHLVDFYLDPEPVAGFVIDDRPPPGAAPPIAKSAGGPAPQTVAIRLEELLVHRSRPWLGADVRVDTIVLTGGRGKPARPAYHAHTERFARIRSGQALPIDRLLLYHGPAVDYLDLAVWVSRDAPDSESLSELMSQEMAGFEMREALAKLTDGLTALPNVAAAITAVSLAAVVVNVAYKMLRRNISDVVGVYRTSMLAQERFGVGRHPADGSRRAQDFSLAYLVDDVTERS